MAVTQQQSGRGFTLIELMVTVAILVTVLGLIISSLTSARRGANEGSAIASLRQIHHAQTSFNAQDVDDDGRFFYARTLGLLRSYDLVDEVVASGTKSGYYFSVSSASRARYDANAVPVDFKVTGDRYFYIDESGVIRYSDLGPAGPGSLAVE